MSELIDCFPKYPKIQSIYKRDMNQKHKPFILGEFTCPEFEYLQNNKWEFTEKVDGTNVRVLWDGKKFKFGGRTDNAQMPMPLIESLESIFVTERFKKVFNDSKVIVYGEGFGGKIQSPMGVKYNETQTFNVFDILIDGWWLQRADVEALCIELRLHVVPTLGYGTLHDTINLVKGNLVSCYGAFNAEGIIAKPELGLKARNGSRIITKIKCKDFRVCNSVG